MHCHFSRHQFPPIARIASQAPIEKRRVISAVRPLVTPLAGLPSVKSSMYDVNFLTSSTLVEREHVYVYIKVMHIILRIPQTQTALPPTPLKG